MMPNDNNARRRPREDHHGRLGTPDRAEAPLRLRRGRPSLLVVNDARVTTRGIVARNRRKTGQASVIVFVLAPQVALKKRLDVGTAARRQAGRVPSLIARHWTLR